MLFDFQRQVGSRNVFTLSYLGAQGRKGQNETNINLPAYQTGWIFGGGVGDTTFNAARPNNLGRFSDIYVIRPNLNSFYNSLIAQFRHDFSNGFQITSNYTWGKTVSDYPWGESAGQQWQFRERCRLSRWRKLRWISISEPDQPR